MLICPHSAEQHQVSAQNWRVTRGNEAGIAGPLIQTVNKRRISTIARAPSNVIDLFEVIG